MTSPRWSPSVTVAAVVERGGRFLVVQEHTPDGLKLNNPAGHLDPGESLLQAVARECLEETACTFVPQALLGVYLARLQRPARQGFGAADGGPAADGAAAGDTLAEGAAAGSAAAEGAAAGSAAADAPAAGSAAADAPAARGASAQDITYLRFAYAGTVGEPEPGRALDVPIVRTLWLTADELRARADEHRSPLLMRCVDDFLAGRRYPLDAVGAEPSVFVPPAGG